MKLSNAARMPTGSNWLAETWRKCCASSRHTNGLQPAHLPESAYSQFVAEVLSEPNVIQSSTVAVWSDSPYTGIAEGEVVFTNGLRLRIREEVDFDAGLIISYGYEVYRGEERLFWYDDFPHPNDLKLASTLPHHKHIPPDIKHNRIPAPSMSFERPNLPTIIQETDELGKASESGLT